MSRGRSEQPRRPRRRVLRRAVILLLVVAVPASALWLGVQITLSTDLPRALVEQALRRQTGLDVSIGALTTGWSGNTTVRELRVGLPLEDGPLLEAPRVRVSHTGLLLLLLTRSVEVTRIAVEDPALTLRRDEAGRWNVAEAADLVSRTRRALSGAGGGPPPRALPDVLVRGATLRIDRSGRAPAVYEQVRFEGAADGPGPWTFALACGSALDVTGRVAPGTGMRHDVRFRVQAPLDVAGAFVELPDLPAVPRVTGDWSGSLTATGVRGRLELDPFAVGDDEVAADVLLALEGGAVRATIRSLDVRLAGGERTVRVTGGSIEADGGRILAAHVALRALGVEAGCDAEWDVAGGTGELAVAWNGGSRGPLLAHRGSLAATVVRPRHGPTRVEGRARVTAQMEGGELRAVVGADAEGDSLDAMTGTVTLPQLLWTDERGTADFGAAGFTATVADRRLRVSRLSLARAAAVAGGGTYDWSSGAWSLDVSVDGWRGPRLTGRGRPAIDLAVAATGDGGGAELSRLVLARGEAKLTASGTYRGDRGTPLEAQAALRIGSLRAGPGPAATGGAEAGGGALRAEVDVTGSARPLRLTWAGNVHVRDLPVARGRVDSLEAPWRGTITPEGFHFETERFSLLDGAWRVGGGYDVASGDARLDLFGEQVALAALLKLFDYPLTAEGMVSGELEMRLPDLELPAIQAAGEWQVADLRVGAFHASAGRGRLEARDGRVVLRDARVERGDGWIEGSAELDLRRRDELLLEINAQQWAVPAAGAVQALVDGSADLDVDVLKLSATGRVGLDVVLRANRDRAGELRVEGGIEGRTLTLESVTGRLLGAEIEGRAQIPLDRWTTTTAAVDWRGLDLATLQALHPSATGFTGAGSGSIVVGPAVEPHALEPLEVRLEGDFEDGGYRSVALTGLSLRAMIGARRQVIDSLRLDVAGGEASLWARIAPQGDARAGHAVLRLEDLELKQFVRLRTPEAETPGLIRGEVSFGGTVNHPGRAFGSGTVLLKQSDLGALPLFTTLYDLLRLDFAKRDATGEGRVAFRIEGRSLVVDRLIYFNRGTEVVANVRVDDMWAGGAGALEGLALGAAVPFRDLDIPFFDDLDRLTRALQTDTAAVRIGGTVAEPEIRPVPLRELGTDLQRMLQAGFAP